MDCVRLHNLNLFLFCSHTHTYILYTYNTHTQINLSLMFFPIYRMNITVHNMQTTKENRTELMSNIYR